MSLALRVHETVRALANLTLSDLESTDWSIDTWSTHHFIGLKGQSLKGKSDKPMG
jgi:hypothetical protein